MVDIDYYTAELQEQEKNNDEEELQSVGDSDELETQEFYESEYGKSEDCELIATDDVNEWERSPYWDMGNGITGIFTI